MGIQFFLSPEQIEMIKCTSNALLAAKISFANEIGNLCKKLGVDIRESRSIPAIEKLLAAGAKPVCYDPMASEAMQSLLPPADALREADGCLVMTEWPEFTKLDKEFNLMKTRAIIDGRHILSIPDAEGICW